MPIVDSTVGGVASNSYVSLLEADTYFSDMYNKPLWAPLTEGVKSQLVVSATASLDAYIQWNGSRTTLDQALDWPRTGAYDRDNVMYPIDEIPHLIKVATFELAYHFLVNGGLTFDQNKIDEVKVGSIGVKFSSYIVDTGIPSYIEAMLAHVGGSLIVDRGKVMMAKLVRV